MSRSGPGRIAAATALALLVAAAATAAPIAVRGLVTAASGTGRAGASVELRPFLSNYELQLSLLARRPGPPAVAATTTDASGRFALDAPGPGVYRVVVAAAGCVPMRYFLLPLANPVVLPPVVLPPAARTRIAVTDAAGHPLPDAAVYAESAAPQRWQRWATGGWRTGARLGWTDDQGRLTVPRLRGEGLQVHVFMPGSAQAWRREEVDEATVVVASRPRGQRVIEVRDSQGRPVAGVVAAIGDLAWPVGRTADDGRLVLDAAPATALELHLFTARGVRWSTPIAAADENHPGPAVVELSAPVRFTGRVVAAGGRPLAGALVWLPHDPGTFARTDADGGYQLAAPPGPRFRVQADAPGYLSRAMRVETPAATRGTPPTLALEPAAAIGGRVVDGQGAPLAGVTLEAAARSPEQLPPAYRPDPVVSRTLSAADGEFVVGNLQAGGVYVLTAKRPGLTTATVEVAGPDPATVPEGLRIVLASGRLAFGRVIDLAERPLAGVEVALRAAADGADEILRRPAGEGAVSALSDAAGRFEVHRLPALRLDLVAHREGLAPLVVRGVEVPPGDDAVDLGTLILEPGAALRGIVVDPREEPIAGAELWVAADRGRPQVSAAERMTQDPDAVADEDGRFLVGDLPPGRKVQLFCDRTGYLPAAVAGLGVPNPEPVVVVLEPASRVGGEVVGQSGEPIAGAEVSLWPESSSEPAARRLGGGSHVTRTDDRGRFVFADVAPGRARVAAFAPGFQPSAERALEVPARQEIGDLRFVLQRGATLEGWVHDGDGEPIAGARVRAGRPAGVSDDRGLYRVDGIPPGLRTVVVDHPGFNPWREAIDVEPGTNRADFVLAGGYRVTGRVVDEEALPLAGVAVELRPEDPRQSRPYQTTTGDDGGFAWPRVAAGGYRLRAARQGYVTAQVDGVRVAGGSPEPLEVVLGQGGSVAGRILGLAFEDLAGVRVQATGDEQPEQVGRVDYEGRYEVTDLGPGDWLVTARVRDGSRQAEARVTLDGATARVIRDLEFGRGLTLTGQVLSAGASLAGARVSLRGHDVAGNRAVKTDHEGRFRLEDLRPGRYRLAVAYRPQSLFYSQDLELGSDREVVIEIATAGVSGWVVSASTSEPLPDALVALRQQLGADAEEGSLFTVGTDAQGLFAFDRLPAGRFRLTVRADGYEPAERMVELGAGVWREGLEIGLAPAAGLDLVVRLASGGTPRFVHLRALDGSGRAVVAETRVADPEGYVHFATVPPGSWELMVGAPEGAVARLTAPVPGDPVVVTLPAAGRLLVRVPALADSDAVAVLSLTGPDGRPLVRLDSGGEVRSQWPVVGGRATVPGVPAGFWTLTVNAPDGRSWVGAVTTTGGPDVRTTLE